MGHRNTDPELTFVLRCGDDEELVGHALTRLLPHLRGLDLRFQLIVADEGSGDNTLALVSLLRRHNPEIEVVHADTGRGYIVAAEQARGRLVALADVRKEPALAALGYALARAERGSDVVSVGNRLLLFRRTRALRALDSLGTAGRREPTRFVRRARSLRLGVAEVHPRRQRMLDLLRQVLPSFLP